MSWNKVDTCLNQPNDVAISVACPQPHLRTMRKTNNNFQLFSSHLQTAHTNWIPGQFKFHKPNDLEQSRNDQRIAKLHFQMTSSLPSLSSWFVLRFVLAGLSVRLGWSFGSSWLVFRFVLVGLSLRLVHLTVCHVLVRLSGSSLIVFRFVLVRLSGSSLFVFRFVLVRLSGSSSFVFRFVLVRLSGSSLFVFRFVLVRLSGSSLFVFRFVLVRLSVSFSVRLSTIYGIIREFPDDAVDRPKLGIKY